MAEKERAPSRGALKPKSDRTGQVETGTGAVKSTLEVALAFLDLFPNARLFPIRPGHKHPPCFPGNLALASNDPERLRRWHQRWPGCNWGLALKLSGFLVVDVDMKEGKHGRDTAAALHKLHKFPRTMKVTTPSGGLHMYYIGPHIFALGKSGFGPDVDSPNYVLIPGCTLAVGGDYRLANNDPVVAAPSWFYDLLGTPKERAAAGALPVVELDQPSHIEWARDHLLNDAPHAVEGQSGELVTLKVAMTLRDNGISEDEALDLMLDYWNEDKADPPWNFEDLKTKIHNAYLYASHRAPGAATAQHEFAEPYTGTIKEYARPSRWEVRRNKNKRRKAFDRARKFGRNR